MRGFDVLVVCVFSALLLTPAMWLVNSEPPTITEPDGVYDINVYLVEGGNLSTTPQSVTAPISIDQSESTDFSKILEGDMLIKGELLEGGYGFKLHLQARSGSGSSATLRIRLYDGDAATPVATGNVDVLLPSVYDVDMIFGSGEEHTFSRGNRFRLNVRAETGNARLTVGEQGYGRMALRALTISDISHLSLNSRGEETESFPVNEWPSRTVNVTGAVAAAFGSQDISSVQVTIREGTTVLSDQLATRSGLLYWSSWNFTGREAGEYSYRVTVTDAQYNEYMVNRAFYIVSTGLLLTTPLQSPEGTGPVNDTVTPRSSLEFTLNVRNTGAASLTATLTKTGDSGNVVLKGDDLANGSTVENIPANGNKSVIVNVTGTGRTIGSFMNFSIRADSGALSYSLDVSIEVVPVFGVSLSAVRTETYVYPGEAATYDCTIKNTSPDIADTFNVTFDVPDYDGWNATLPSEGIYSLSPGEETVFTVQVKSPVSIDVLTEKFDILIRAISEFDPDVRDYLTITTIVTKGVTIEDPGVKSVDPDSSLVVDVVIENLHGEQNTFALSVTSPTTWKDENPVLRPPFITVDALGKGNVEMTLQPRLRNTPARTHEFTMKAESLDNASIFATQIIRVTVNERKLYSIEAASTLYGSVAGEMSRVSVDVDISNRGNVVQPILLKCDVYISGGQREKMEWSTQYSIEGNETGEQLSPQMGETSSLTLTIDIPREAQVGYYNIELTIVDGAGNVMELEGYDETFTINLNVEAPAGAMLMIALYELWIPVLLFILVIAVGVMTAMKSGKTKAKAEE